MVDAKVADIVNNFRSLWSRHLVRSPLLELDGNWPSVGIIDLMTFPLRHRDELGQREGVLITECAAYLAVIAERCWIALGAEVKVQNGLHGICISMSGGPLSSGKRFIVHVERDLREYLRKVPVPLPVIGEFRRVLTFDGNLVSSYALGLMLGLAPSGDGPLKTEPLGSYKPHLEIAERELARQSVDYYTRVFPDEPLGQVAELYLCRLIFPPVLMAEPYPAMNAVHHLIDFFHDYRVNKRMMMNLCHNLALSPDELQSSVGMVFYTALLEEDPPSEILAAAQAKGRNMALLRPAMLYVREQFGLRPDWITEPEVTAEDLRRYEIEVQLGFLPWFNLRPSKVASKSTDPNLTEFLQALSINDFPQAVRIADQIIESNPSDLEMRVQRVYLDLYQGDIDRARHGAKSLSTEPEAETDSRFFHLWGLCEIYQGDTESASRRFNTALELCNENGVFRAEVANDLACALIESENFERALEVLDYAMPYSPSPVSVLLNKVFVLERLGQVEEASLIHSQILIRLAPTDRRVVGRLVYKYVS